MVNKEFSSKQFNYPILSGLYTSRLYALVESDPCVYILSQYYENGEEGILIHADRGDGGAADVVKIKSRQGISFRPVGACTEGEELYVFWSEREKGQWYVKCARVFRGEVVPLPDLRMEGYSLLAASAAWNEGGVLLACEQLRPGGYSSIRLFQMQNGGFSDLGLLSEESLFSSRPVIAANGREYSVLWDSYSQRGYDIYCYHRGAVSKLTDTPDWEISPSALMDRDGTVYACWLSNDDVERDGVIAKKNIIKCARIDSEAHFLPDAAELDLGLLPGKTYFGYSGVRRLPQIQLFADGRLGVFWESHRDEQGPGVNIENGVYCLKIFEGGKWSEPICVHDGYCCFRTGSSQKTPGIITFACRGVRNDKDNFHVMRLDLAELKPAGLPTYPEFGDWKRIALPTAQALAAKGKNGLLWGDFHCHGIYSPDAEGWPDELFFYARDKALLDFSGITENDYYPENVLFTSNMRYVELIASVLAKEGEFLPYAGFEWTFHQKDGQSEGRWNHRSIVYLAPDQPVARRGEDSGQGESAFLQTMGESRTFWHAHHGNWSLMDQEHEPNVEVTSAWAKNIEMFDTIDSVLKSGTLIGFMGSSDNHRFIPGYGGALTAVKCGEVTYGALENALICRRVYATAGNRAAVSLSVNGTGMGNTLRVEKGETLGISLACDSIVPIEQILLICDGIPVKTYSRPECGQLLSEEIIYEDYAYCFVKVILQGSREEFPHNIALAEGPEIWSSPVLFTKTGR